MQQRQLRLGDILDDYCPRERRVTNHAVVAMVGPDVKQTRCTTCDSEHEYKHAKVPRQRRKGETPAALYAQVAAGAPKRVTHENPAAPGHEPAGLDDVHDDLPMEEHQFEDESQAPEPLAAEPAAESIEHETAPDDDEDPTREEGPVHRPLIRASLPRPEGQAPPARPLPEFTIRQPGGGRPNRFRPRQHRGQQGSFGGGNRPNGNFAGPPRGMRPGGGRPPMGAKRHHGGGGGRKRSK